MDEGETALVAIVSAAEVYVGEVVSGAAELSVTDGMLGALEASDAVTLLMVDAALLGAAA